MSKNLQDELKSKSRIFYRLKAERQIKLGKLKRELEEAQARGITGQALQGYQDRIDLYDGISAKSIEESKAVLEGLEATAAAEAQQQQQAARADLAALKERHKAEWIKGGGTAEGFEQSWPGMQTKILEARTLSAIDQEPDLAEAVAKKRAQIGSL